MKNILTTFNHLINMPRYPNISDTPDRFGSIGEKLCRNCGKAVSKRRRHYCSLECMETFNRNNSWFYVRMDVLKRDRYKCSVCNKRFRKKELKLPNPEGWGF
jgi:hypothetical protein